MGSGLAWQMGILLVGLLWLLALSLRLRRLARRLDAVAPTARPAEVYARQTVSVAELLAREDPQRSEPSADRRSTDPAGPAADSNPTMPVPAMRPRQQIRLWPPAQTTEDDPGFWFRPVTQPRAD